MANLHLLLKEDPKGKKIQLALNRSVAISHNHIESQLIPLNNCDCTLICIFKLMNESPQRTYVSHITHPWIHSIVDPKSTHC